MGKHKFIDKKKAATFALLYKESQDEENAGERVFTRVDNNEVEVPGFEETDEEEIESEELERYIPGMPLPAHLRKELLEMGFPDDGYNYLKHMRTIGASGTALFVQARESVDHQLPVDVKVYDASTVPVQRSSSDAEASEKVLTSVKKIQAPISKVRGLDSDVKAMLEESDVSEDECGESDMEDDFVLIANKDVEVRKAKPVEADVEVVESDSDHEGSVVSVATASKRDEERAIGVIDEQFAVLTMKEYDSDGDGDGFEDDADPRARGQAHISEYNDILDEFLAANPVLCGRAPASTSAAAEPEVKEVVKEQADEPTDEENESEEEEFEEVEVDDDNNVQWDCETIVSTYSNLDNHPARIGVPTSRRVKFASVVHENTTEQTIRLGGKERLPVDFLKRGKRPNEKADKAALPQRKSVIGTESREERKARKAAVKEERRSSRQAKKELKEEFKTASQKAQVGASLVMRTIHL